MNIVLKKPSKRVNFGKVFWKAVAGNKVLQANMARGTKPMPVSVENFDRAFPIEIFQSMLPYMKSEKITEIRETEKIPVGIPLEVIGGGGYGARPEVSITRAIGPIKIKELEVNPKEINLVYELIPSGGSVPFAAANIKWSEKDSSLIYYVIEPVLSLEEVDLLNKIKTNLIEKLDVDFASLRKDDARSYLNQKFEEIVNIMALNLPEDKKKQVLYFIERDFIGLGKIEALMKDPNIEDISCDGISIPIFIFHRNPVIGSIKTNVSFGSKEELDIFVNKIAQRCGKNVSIAQPLIGGSLPDGSRVQATLGTDIARKGSNFTIRKFTERPLTPVNLLKFKTFDPKIAAFLWLVVEYGRSILISGGVATGKTTLLNALSLFIKPELKIVSIEDTAELLLPHPHWVPSVARLPIAELEGKKLGEVDLFDLLRESLRQRPDYLIVGEVRGKEAYVLFQQIASIPGGEKVFIFEDNQMKQVPIKDLKPGVQYNIPTIDPFSQKTETLPIRTRLEHSKVDELYKIKTKSGREVITTSAHSVFTCSNEEVIPIMVKDLKVGDKIIIPSKLPSEFCDIDSLNLIDLLPDLRVYSPELIKRASRKLGFEKASEAAGFTTISNYYGVNNCALPARSFMKLMDKAEINYREEKEKIKVRFERNSTKSDADLKLTKEFLKLLGYFISEGSINLAKRNYSISLYNSNKKIIDDMKRCIKAVTGKKPRERTTKGWGESLELTFNHKTLFELFKRYVGTNCYNKRIPHFILGLSKEKIGHFLSALYDGDGSFSDDLFYYRTSSKELANDLLTLLLILNIVGRLKKRSEKDYEVKFYTKEFKERFVKVTSSIKNKVNLETKTSLKRIKNDIYEDEIRSLEIIKLETPEPVYDLHVPRVNTFLGGSGGILLHNTGHASMSTMHADSIERLVDRLTTPPISLPANLIEALDLVIFVVRIKYGSTYVRRVNSIYEVLGFDRDKDFPIINEIFRWKASNDTFEAINSSVVLKKITQQYGITEQSLQKELTNRVKIFNWMVENNIDDYLDVSKIINLYYQNPEEVLSAI